MHKAEKKELSTKESVWKNKDKTYLFALQKFLDLTENIKDEELRKEIVAQMLKGDRCLTKLAEQLFYKIQKNENKGIKK